MSIDFLLYVILKYLYTLYFQARHNGQSYVFALLTGYRDPPAGISVNSSLKTF